MHQDHQHGAVQRVFTVQRKLLQGFHLLGFLHNHKLALCHHGETSGGRDYGFCVNLTAVANRLVEVLFPVLKAVLKDCVTYKVRVIGFVSHKQIYTLEDASTDIFKYVLDLTGGLYVTLLGCHVIWRISFPWRVRYAP